MHFDLTKQAALGSDLKYFPQIIPTYFPQLAPLEDDGMLRPSIRDLLGATGASGTEVTIDDSQSLECQRRARECIDRATQSTNQITRDAFAAMAETWAQLPRAMAGSASQLDRRE